MGRLFDHGVRGVGDTEPDIFTLVAELAALAMHDEFRDTRKATLIWEDIVTRVRVAGDEGLLPALLVEQGKQFSE